MRYKPTSLHAAAWALWKNIDFSYRSSPGMHAGIGRRWLGHVTPVWRHDIRAMSQRWRQESAVRAAAAAAERRYI